MSEVRSKSNKKFMLLSAIGIFMVVDHHTFTALNIFGDLIPYNSFFMPMFVFISGYFNKVDGSTDLWKYFLKKIKTLLIPYVGLSLTVFGLQQLINYIKLGNEATPLPPDYLSFVLDRIVTKGSYGGIVEPMWFVIALFCSLMIYAVLKKVLDKLGLWNSYVMLALFIGLHLFAIYVAKNNDFETIKYYLVPLKCMFFFPFIELGILYKEHLEKKHSSMSGGSKLALMFILLVINAVRTVYMPAPYDIAFDGIDEMVGFTSPYLVTPLVSSVIGILFWLTFSELIEKQVGDSKFVNFMSCNTFWIMGLHITFYNILNLVLMFISTNIVELPYFDVDGFKAIEWYFWGISGNIKILYVMVGILGPLGMKWVYDKLYAAIDGKIKSLGQGSEQKTKKLNMIAKPVLALLYVGLIAAVVLLTSPKPDVTAAEADDDVQVITEDDEPDITEDDGQDGGEAVPAEASPVYAYLDLAYEYNGGAADYLTEPCAVNGSGTFTVTVDRGDTEETPLAFDGLSYMGIRLIDDEASDLDIKNASITDVKVVCDGTALKVDTSGATPYEDGVILIFFDCYDPEKYGSTEDLTGAEPYDFGGKSRIEVSFTVEGAKPQ